MRALISQLINMWCHNLENERRQLKVNSVCVYGVKVDLNKIQHRERERKATWL